MGLFDTQIERLPDHYPWAQEIIEAMQDGFWTHKKFTFDSDVADYKNRLTPKQRLMVQRVLAAIAQIEVKVKEFWKFLGNNFPHPSISDLGITLAYIEVIHNRAYEELLKCLGLTHIFKENMHEPALAGRVSYLSKHAAKVYSDNRKQYVYSLVLFTLFVENVSLFSQFYVIMFLYRFNGALLKDAAQQVKYTRNEELLHGITGSRLINTLRVEYPELFDADLEEKVRQEAHEAFKAESNLIDWFLGDYADEGFEQDGTRCVLDAPTLKSFVAHRLNSSLGDIGYAPIFTVPDEDASNFAWMMQGVAVQAKVDFFHAEPTSYQVADQSDDDDF